MRVNQKFWGPVGIVLSTVYFYQKQTLETQKKNIPKTNKWDTIAAPISPPQKPYVVKINPPPKT